MYPTTPSCNRCLTRNARALVIALSLFCAPVHAAIYKVGPTGTGCTHTDIQSALDAAQSNPGADTVRIVHALTGTGLHGVVTAAQDVTIDGGYATCTAATPDGGQTVISAAGTTAFKVFSISTTGTATVRLQSLQLTDGFASGGGYGGGVYFKGTGNLEINDTRIDNNRAGYGAGIYFEGTSATATLTIGAHNLINSNVASVSGGGIYLQNAIMVMTAADSSILFNTAAQYGGGLRIYGRSTATVSSDGFGSFAAIQGNEAAYGGAVAIQGYEDGAGTATFHLEAGARIYDNFASVRGGALFQQPFSGLSTGYANAEIDGGVLDTNVAPEGAAAYLAYDEDFTGFAIGGSLAMNNGSVINNLSGDANGQATAGATIVVARKSGFTIFKGLMGNNSGGSLVRADDGYTSFLSSLLTGNVVQRGLVEVLSDSLVEITASTIVGNTVSGGVVLTGTGALRLKQSIVWQPGKQTAQIASNRDVDDVIASEIASLPAGESIISADPRFVDPGHVDYRLQPASPAVDFSGVLTNPGVDGLLHNKDMALVANRYGAGDLGAYELQSISNLIRNATFLSDLRLWTPLINGASTWIASGAGNAGGVTISRSPVPASGELVALTQCVHIPGPGTYQLDGRARGGSDISGLLRDRPVLRWQLRTNPGTETCTGTANIRGDVSFPNGLSFAAANRPAQIVITPAMWTRFTSVEVTLVAQEGDTNPSGTTTASFDDIVLKAIDADVIFADGFNP